MCDTEPALYAEYCLRLGASDPSPHSVFEVCFFSFETNQNFTQHLPTPDQATSNRTPVSSSLRSVRGLCLVICMMPWSIVVCMTHCTSIRAQTAGMPRAVYEVLPVFQPRPEDRRRQSRDRTKRKPVYKRRIYQELSELSERERETTKQRSGRHAARDAPPVPTTLPCPAARSARGPLMQHTLRCEIRAVLIHQGQRAQTKATETASTLLWENRRRRDLRPLSLQGRA